MKSWETVIDTCWKCEMRGWGESLWWRGQDDNPLAYFPGSAGAAAKSLQSCSTLCDPIDGSPPGSPVPGTLQARTLEWFAISFSNAWKWKVKVKLLSHVWLLATPWTAAYQAPLSMGFSRQEYWNGVPLPSPGSASLKALSDVASADALGPSRNTPWPTKTNEARI